MRVKDHKAATGIVVRFTSSEAAFRFVLPGTAIRKCRKCLFLTNDPKVKKCPNDQRRLFREKVER